MFTFLPDMPSGIIGIAVSGRVSGDDIRAFQPLVDELHSGAEPPRVVGLIENDYEGFGSESLAADVRVVFGALFSHHPGVQRFAVVSSLRCPPDSAQVVTGLIPRKMKHFELDELDQATAWAAS